jgi:predicted ATPase
MRLARLHVRFFRSFNFDYERKAHQDAKPREWEMIGDEWYPFISVPLDPTMTAIVGANESGKSHLIDALAQALTGEQISRRDFCRYSALFSVEKDRVRAPDLGIDVEINENDASVLSAAEISVQAGDLVTLLRFGDDGRSIITSTGDATPLTVGQAAAIDALLPAPFVLPADVPLPDSITLDEILGRPSRWALARPQRAALRTTLAKVAAATPEAVTTEASGIATALTPYDDGERRLATINLARSLLLDVARIATSAFEDLETALDEGREGQVGGLVESMNRALARRLNFSRWWRQDRDFELRLSPRDDELVFTIRDRTGTDYSFSERSKGLRFFLGYYVQLLAHERPESRSQVLLMDEPDAYLSSVAQQDLLRVLEHFAAPEGRKGDQVVYVTHSPFLIDKNASGRIRVLDKGSNEEGTRVVNDAVRNHYEPLRSSIGAFVAETAFLGGSNLIVEGAADQVLLSGINALLRRRGNPPSRLLDLNDTTIVPAGSASQVPYMTYLARGRDELKPACVVLLDGDEAGRDAHKQLMRSTDGRRKRVIAQKFVVSLDAWAADAELRTEGDFQVQEIEDLVPLQVAAHAARGYAMRLLGLTADEAKALTHASISAQLATENVEGVWQGLQRAFADAYGSHIDKLGFAKELVRYVESVETSTNRPAGLLALEEKFAALIARIADLLAEAMANENERRTAKRSDEIVRSFLSDHPYGATKDTAARTLREIDASLEASLGDDAVARQLQIMRRMFKLDTDPLAPVDEYPQFAERLGALKVTRREAYRA